MKVAITGDIHAPLRLHDFLENLNELPGDIEYFFLLGDIVDRGNFVYLKKVYNEIKRHFPEVEICSVFGNNEYIQYREYLKKEYGFMNWLDDTSVELGDFLIFGTSGALDRPTNWQRRNIPWIKEVWEERLKKIERFFEENKNRRIIIVSHYSPVCETVFGDPGPKEVLCSSRFEEIIRKYQPEYVFHAHAHGAKIWRTEIGKTKVYNVSFYIHNRVLVFDIK